MRVLVSCLNVGGYGGSELYHYELLIGLSKYKDLDITFAALTPPDLNFHLYRDLVEHGISVTHLENLTESFDLIVASQPFPNTFLCNKYPNTPKISIIHSALRSEDAIKHPSIVHYIAVQPDIYRHLKNVYNIKTSKISLIYNPIDTDRFRQQEKITEGTTGVLVGEVQDPLRRPMVNHIVSECIDRGINLIIISRSKHNFNHRLIQIKDQLYNTEKYLAGADFTVGLGGRTTIEGWLCGLPSYIYKVNTYGDILDIQLKYPPKIYRFKRDYVTKQHYDIYKAIIERHEDVNSNTKSQLT